MNKKSQTADGLVITRVATIPGAVFTLIEPTGEEEFDPIAEDSEGEAVALPQTGDSAAEAGFLTKEK